MRIPTNINRLRLSRSLPAFTLALAAMGLFPTMQGQAQSAGAPLPPTPTHRYSFNNPAGAAANGAEVTDSVGGANGAVRGEGALFSGSRIALPGGSSSSAPYVDLPNNLLSNNSTNRGGTGRVTLEGWVKITGVRAWARVFDFGACNGAEITGPGGGGGGTDVFLYAAMRGVTPIQRRVEKVGAGGVIGDYDAFNFDRDLHFVVTWDEATGQIRAYENGVQVVSMTAGAAMSTVNDVNAWLGRSNWTGDNNTEGEYDEFRVYNRVLTLDEVLADFQLGPDWLATTGPVSIAAQPQSVTVTEGGSATFSIVANGTTPITHQWFTNDVLVPGATTASLTVGPLLLTDHNTRVYCIASNNVLGTPYTATSTVATITVLADTNPPSIARARVADLNQIEVSFSEPVNSADAGTASNYGVSGPAGTLAVSTAVVQTPTRVLLTLAANLECAFYNVGVTNIRDTSTAQNSNSGTSAGFWNFTPPNLTHRYTFNNVPAANATGATVPDVVGSADGVVLNGSGFTTFTGDRITLSGGASAIAPYVDLPNHFLSDNSTNRPGGTGKLTLEGWFKVTGVQGWSRVFDFGSGTAGELTAPGGGAEGRDYLMYAAMVGLEASRRQVDKNGVGGGYSAFNVGNYNKDVHLVVTWDEATGVISAYEDGQVAGTFATTGNMSDVNDVNVWLGRSNWTGDNNMQGEFDEFRLYSRVFNTNDVARNFAGGPDSDLGAPLGMEFTIGSTNIVTNSVRQSSFRVNFAKAGWQDVAASGCVVYNSSNPSAVEVTPEGLLLSHDVGTANLSATFNGSNMTAQINVITDITPPTIVRARALGSRYVEIQFSEQLAAGAPSQVFSFALRDSSDAELNLLAAEHLADASRVVLTLENPMPCDKIMLVVNDVTDIAGNPIATDSTTNFMNLVLKGMTHRYTFNDWAGSTPSGTRVLDGIAGASGFILGAGATNTSDRVSLPGGSSATAPYVDLPNGLLSVNGVVNGGSGELTFEGWFKNTGAKNWGRIFDFGSSLGAEVTGPGGGGEGWDYFMLSAEVGTDVNARRTELRNRDPIDIGATYTRDHATTDFNKDTHFAVTWKENTGVINTYANGSLVSSMTVPTQMSDINDVNVWLGRSNWTGDENVQGEYDEFRVYSKVLTSAELAFAQTTGPDINVGLPVAVRVTGPTAMQVGQTLPPAAFVDFTGYTGLDINLINCTTLLSSAPGTVAITPQGQLQALAPGSADISAQFAGLTGVGTVYVVDGVIPPTNHVAITVTGGSNVGIRYNGVPGLTYKLRRAPTVVGPWDVIDTRVAPGSGVIDFADPTPLVPNSFYKVEGP